MLSLTVAVFLVWAGSCQAGPQTVANSCPSARVLKPADNLSELRSALFSMQAHTPQSSPIRAMISSVLEVLDRMTAVSDDPAAWASSAELQMRLHRLAAALFPSSVLFGPSPANELGTRFAAFAKKYWNSAQRKADPDGFRKGIEDVLSVTAAGKGPLDCSRRIRADQARFSGPHYRYVDAPDSAFWMNTNVDDGEGGRRSVTFDFTGDGDPALAISLYAHEMQHGCKIADAQPGVPRGSPRKRNQDSFFTEILAHRVQLRVLQELAAAAPAQFCGRVYVSGRLGGQVVTGAEDAATLENQFESGEFPRQLAVRYSRFKQFALENIVENPASAATHEGQRTLKFLPELLLRLKQAGIAVN